MDDTAYRPWRRADSDDDVLACEVSANWQRLLDESKRAVSMLRQATEQADRRLDTGRRVLSAMQSQSHHSQLDRIQHRLSTLEHRLTQIEMRLSIDHSAPAHLHRHAA